MPATTLPRTNRARETPGGELLDGALRLMARQYDEGNGGFGGAPKFPQPVTLEVLLRHHARTGEPDALRMATIPCAAWPPAGCATTWEEDSTATRWTRAGWSPTSRRCCTTTRCSPGCTWTRGAERGGGPARRGRADAGLPPGRPPGPGGGLLRRPGRRLRGRGGALLPVERQPGGGGPDPSPTHASSCGPTTSRPAGTSREATSSGFPTTRPRGPRPRDGTRRTGVAAGAGPAGTAGGRAEAGASLPGREGDRRLERHGTARLRRRRGGPGAGTDYLDAARACAGFLLDWLRPGGELFHVWKGGSGCDPRLPRGLGGPGQRPAVPL